ncbi:mammalian ependymin-related protein 1-like [Dreissena polymorpha]|uniref:Uncharacterized protein n=1 Tax=Dreissena polymorpha TaxID=45954 RepID=A0A9D4LS74_DREPO|nr:mammalian ependymin-related protein 1-like [Dreissena polymorpha]KAH3863091.1 hypothetical protein DPMN_026069 [Dreissena polymorpha]
MCTVTMWKCLAFMCALATTAHSDSCCVPTQFECSEGTMTGSADDDGNTALAQALIKFSFDGNGKRVYSVEQVIVGNQSDTYTILQLYNQGQQYVIHNGVCSRGSLETWGNKGCIPDTATVSGTYQLGYGQNIWITTYSWSIPSPTASVSLGVTDNCVPVVEIFTGQQEGTSFLALQGFQNITLGIKDPSVFVVPDICKHQSTSVPVPMYRRRRSTLF